MAVCRVDGDALEHESLISPVSDRVLYREIRGRLDLGDVCVGLDAPLSYGRKGGQRRSDAELRATAMEAGLPPGSVMAPTAPRMAYLTLRGVAVAHGLRMLDGPGTLQVIETHPGAALVLGGAPIDAVRGFKADPEARLRLLHWMKERGLSGIENSLVTTDHVLAAVAAAWATWHWSRKESAWLFPANPPRHPFDFAC